MANFKEWVINFLEAPLLDENGVPFETVEVTRQMSSLAYKELGINMCVNLIANSISQCTCRTYENKEEMFGQNYYILNVRPNINENSSMFWHKAIEHLIYQGECLIVNVKGCLYVAESYNVNEFPIKGNIFEGVTIGNLQLNKKFKQDEVIYLKLNNTNIKRVIDNLYNSYDEMLNLCIEKYEIDNQQKYTLELDNVKVGDKLFNEKFGDIIQEQLYKFLNNNNTVLPLYKGQQLTNVSKQGTVSSNDFQSLIENLFKTIAQAFGIPLNLLYGKSDNITRDIKQFLTLTIEPIASMISEELSDKLYNGFEGFVNNNYVKLDTSDIRHIDILEMASAIDKILASGVCSINELRDIVGFNELDEEWADKHWMTKNYALAESMLNPPKEEYDNNEVLDNEVVNEPSETDEGGEEDE